MNDFQHVQHKCMHAKPLAYEIKTAGNRMVNVTRSFCPFFSMAQCTHLLYPAVFFKLFPQGWWVGGRERHFQSGMSHWLSCLTEFLVFWPWCPDMSHNPLHLYWPITTTTPPASSRTAIRSSKTLSHTHTHTDSLATCFLYLDLVNRMSLAKIILLKCACVMGSVVFAVWSSCFHWSVELITQRETLEHDSFTRIRFYSVRYWYVTFTLFTHSESLNWLQFGISIDAF